VSEFSEGPQQTPFVAPSVSGDVPYSPVRVVVIAFATPAEAQSALADVKSLVAAEQLRVADASVVEPREDGTLHVTETADMGGRGGAVRGGVAGVLVGTLALVPVAGLAIGAAAGALLARRRDSGVSRQFQQRIGEVLRPGAAALALLVEGGADADALNQTVSRWHGQVVTTDLDETTERDLREALAAEAE
jgi:uncharacterized membrane protein